MKLLVSGGAGFIGSNFIRYWLEKYPSDLIINLDKLTYAGNLENLKGIEHHANYRFIHGDIANPETVDKAMTKVDTLVNFAAESHVDRSIHEPSIFIKTNIVGTHVLLECALKHGIRRFHHVSTDEVFGALTLNERRKFNEQTPYNPRSPYAASKAASDHLVRAYYFTYGLPITISNCSNNFGPYQFPEKLIPLAITNALEEKSVPIYGDGLYLRDWLYVRDHCHAIDLILTKGKIGETYCIGGLTQELANKEIVRSILRHLDKSEKLMAYVKDRPGHDRRYAIDWTKIRTELGFLPEHDFETSLAMTIKWYKDNPEWWQHVKSGQYKDYYRKQYG